MKQHRRKITALVVVLLLLIGFFLPLPFYLETPGTAESLTKFVTVNGKKDQHKGRYMLTTVALQQARPLTYLWSKTQPFAETVSKEALMGDASSKTYEQMQTYYMQSSINDAITVAYRRAGQTYHKQYRGIYVMSLLAKSKFKSALAIGDTVTKIDGQRFKSAQQFINYVKRQRVGQKVTVTYTHNKQVKTVTQALVKLPGTKRPGLGITLVDHTRVKTDIPVKVNVGEIGGPSAGTMFTLEIYDQLTGGKLRQGRKIAGTGTMDAQGQVGAIGGIDKKVVAASRAGATIFFAPNDKVTKAEKKADPDYQNNYQVAKAAAKRIHSKIKVVPIKTFSDVVNYLQK
ncbi:SepM family pheromone-processing serine protease [Loigolactobacillus jiayinensis]|uniref:endopeptidase La n=1 Tax=Loigolactobacillus jiayinensis TaxID=2486016 RepID=A0ABW1RG58_9LACO|nr:SepM family pheromone-processing serine protease [Loigolactobacillus jiayinensis]